MNVRCVLPRDAIPSVDDPSFAACYPGDDGDDVIGLVRGGAARAYPVRYLHYHEVVNDVVVFATDAGVFAFEHPGLSFDAADGEFRADGTTWDGATGRAADGRALERLPARRLFAFAWQDDHGPDAFYGL